METPLLPIYLFADSQLLFWKRDDSLFISSIRALIGCDQPKAAYVGASNGDAPEYYSIFEAAMEGVGIRDRRQILSAFSDEDRSFVSRSDIILLAGGDVKLGWSMLCRTGLRELLLRRYREGAALIGISAGAVHLGLCGYQGDDSSIEQPFDTLKLVPFVIGAHEEEEDWKSLKAVVRYFDGDATGIGIPAGGGVIYHRHRVIEAVRRPAVEVSAKGNVIGQSTLGVP